MMEAKQTDNFNKNIEGEISSY